MFDNNFLSVHKRKDSRLLTKDIELSASPRILLAPFGRSEQPESSKTSTQARRVLTASLGAKPKGALEQVVHRSLVCAQPGDLHRIGV
ncbi:BnaC05g09470D [Brassica napus]|uniref:BnaC05g09470D protein n=1 Tax=Brassica napus TaxID=3708 RepID=A0A078GZR5_BRANA|nr:BnaC05g09470D [Brassica napus]